MILDIEAQEWLEDRFKGRNSGYLVDVGAGSGERSVTRSFLERGWSGLLIEPLPQSYNALVKEAWTRNAEVFRVALSSHEGKGAFWPSHPDTGMSTLEEDFAQVCENRWEHVNYRLPIPVVLRTLSSVLAEVRAPSRFQLLKIDTESHDHKVLLGMDWTRRVEVVMVETTTPVLSTMIGRKWNVLGKIAQLMESHGYPFLFSTAKGNALFGRTR